ncbi:phosducin-like protein 3 [Octopus sinensis]|uniref:Phosducin-like protein 3 n=1 Tax=Octopus sinensis TaxID=2607531 RepID=A0A7E6EH27_9MOLL|nr:phosducin-like protein 3 [Octopus sinensis]
MQDWKQDTEWNDALRKLGIIPELPKEPEPEEPIHDDGIHPEKMSLKQLEKAEDLFDEEDEIFFQFYKQQKLNQLRLNQQRPSFGSVVEITRQDWTDQVNKAGNNIFVLVHVYNDGFVCGIISSDELCSLINNCMSRLAPLHPFSKFIRGRASTCVENYPHKYCPSLFVYKSGDLIAQYVRSQLPSISCLKG